MTDKEIIIDKIKQLKDLFKTEREKTTTTNKGLVDKLSFSSKIVALEELLVFINSLPAEQPSEELEESAIEFGAKQGLELKPFAIKFFKSGAQWQKQQLLKSAVSGITDCDDSNEWIEITDRFVITPSRAGKRVKIVIMEDA